MNKKISESNVVENKKLVYMLACKTLFPVHKRTVRWKHKREVF